MAVLIEKKVIRIITWNVDSFCFPAYPAEAAAKVKGSELCAFCETRKIGEAMGIAMIERPDATKGSQRVCGDCSKELLQKGVTRFYVGTSGSPEKA